MLTFFPSGLPDETLYSRVARYHQWTGQPDDRYSLKLLLGTHTRVVNSDLPTFASTLLTTSPGLIKETPEEFLLHHTLLPYYVSFLPEHHRARIVSMLLSDCVRQSVKLQLGLMASRIGGQNVLRSCSFCMQEDWENHGQLYWHRSHQLPGVWVCHRHRIPLQEMERAMVQLKRHKLLLPDHSLFIRNSKTISLSNDELARMFEVAKLSTGLLASGPEQRIGMYEHRNNAMRAGFIRENGRLRTAELEESLRKYARCLPPEHEYSSVHHRFLTWALTLLRKPRSGNLHPLKHILLQDCLHQCDVRPTQFKCNVERKLGAAQRRVLTEDVGRRLIQMLDEGVSLRRAATILNASVTTLQVEATRLGCRTSQRPKTITLDVKNIVLDQIRLGKRLKDIARSCNISLVSAYRILRAHPVVEQQYRDAKLLQQRLMYRDCYLERRSAAAYHWLLRHDRAWMSALPRLPAPPRRRWVDWGGRDVAFAAEIQELHHAWVTDPGRPRWISRAALKRAVGTPDTIERHQIDLPLTHQALRTCAESRSEYQARRLRWAHEQLCAHGKPSYSKLLRLAGIGHIYSENAQAAIALSSLNPAW